MGHAGTLDPLATGVLPVCIGQATRLVEYLIDSPKIYLAEIKLGVTTETDDAEGKITSQTDISHITFEQVTTALSSFCGQIQQTPPMYSALKHHGRPLYELARAGVTVARRPRIVTIHSIELKDWRPPSVTAVVACGKGTYIRTLARDLGTALGCGATLHNLVRLKCGIFEIASAVAMEQFQTACRDGYWESLLFPMDSILEHWQAIIVGEEIEIAIRHGRTIALEESGGAGSEMRLCRAYTQCGFLLGILRFDSEKGMWHPEKVFA